MEVATALVHLSYSQVPQVTPTSSRPPLPSVPAQLTTSQHFSDEFSSVTSEKIKLLGKHPANTEDETSSSKCQRILYTSDTLPVAWKPPTCASKFPHHPATPSLTPQDTSSIPATLPVLVTKYCLGGTEVGISTYDSQPEANITPPPLSEQRAPIQQSGVVHLNEGK